MFFFPALAGWCGWLVPARSLPKGSRCSQSGGRARRTGPPHVPHHQCMPHPVPFLVIPPHAHHLITHRKHTLKSKRTWIEQQPENPSWPRKYPQRGRNDTENKSAKATVTTCAASPASKPMEWKSMHRGRERAALSLSISCAPSTFPFSLHSSLFFWQGSPGPWTHFTEEKSHLAWPQ